MNGRSERKKECSAGTGPRTIRQDVLGKNILRLVQVGKSYVGLLLASGQEKGRVLGEEAEAVWLELKALAGKSSVAYFGVDGAISRFRHYFPAGFHSAKFEGAERHYKLNAKLRLDDQVPLEAALTGKGYGEAVLSIYRATNLLSPFEKSRLQPLLRGANADTFIQAAARFAVGEIEPALARMQHLLGSHGSPICPSCGGLMRICF